MSATTVPTAEKVSFADVLIYHLESHKFLYVSDVKKGDFHVVKGGTEPTDERYRFDLIHATDDKQALYKIRHHGDGRYEYLFVSDYKDGNDPIILVRSKSDETKNDFRLKNQGHKYSIQSLSCHRWLYLSGDTLEADDNSGNEEMDLFQIMIVLGG